MSGGLADRRCTLVVAAAGYGKTSMVRDRLASATTHWCSGGETARLAAGLPDDLIELGARHAGGEPGWLVLDDLPRLPDRRSQALLAAVDRLPPRLRVVVLTRHPVRVPSRWRGRGVVATLSAADLALRRDQVADLLLDEYGNADPVFATAVHTATAGWPALVRLAATAVCTAAGAGGEFATVAGVGSPIESYLVREVLADLPPDALRLLRDVARLDWVCPELCGLLGHRNAGDRLARLAAVGVLLPVPGGGTGGTGGIGYRLVPAVAEVAGRRHPLSTEDAAELYAVAGPWYAEHGSAAAALRAYQATGDSAACARLLADHGADLLNTGRAGEVVAAFESLPDRLRSAALRLSYGEALLIRGDAEAALAVYAAAAGRRERLAPALAWRYGLVHYLRAEPHQALGVFSRGRLDTVRTVDEALLLGWTAATRWMTGDTQGCGADARRALAAAGAADDAGARAVAHVAMAFGAKLRGDRAATDEHYGKALRAAETARDAVAVTRIRANRAFALVGEARYAEALAELRPAVDLAYEAGSVPMLALALHNEGEAMLRLGRLTEAIARFERSASIHQRMGSHKVAYSLTGIGDVHRLRGRNSLARAAYEEAVRTSEPRDDVQALVPALSGLAQVLAADADDVEDSEAAVAMARRAVELARGPAAATARLALGWVTLATGAHAAAARVAGTAADAARQHRDRAALAEALELRAATTPDPAEARRALLEAAGIARDIEASVVADRIMSRLGRLPGAAVAERVDATLAAERLVAAEVRAVPDNVPETVAPVRIRTLGRFEVTVNDAPVPATAWQSRKARDLLRILVARCGRPVPREQLAELLWPGDDARRVGHRLSVALSTLRAVLDAGRGAESGNVVVADQASVLLDIGRVELDVTHFLTEASYGLRLADRGESDAARGALLLAERRYEGDFLEDEPYADWATTVRDEARRVHLRAVRELAMLAHKSGDAEDAIRYLGQAVAAEPYDERSHQDLIETLTSVGWHGEAANAYRAYADAMHTIGISPMRRPN